MPQTNSHSPSQKPVSGRHDKTAAVASQPQLQPTVSHDAIAKKAYEKYLGRSSVDGQHEADWLAAELELAPK